MSPPSRRPVGQILLNVVVVSTTYFTHGLYSRICSRKRRPQVRPSPARAPADVAKGGLRAPREKRAPSVLLAVGALAGRRLPGRERIDRSHAALLEVLVGLRLLLFLVAAHLTLGHDDLPGAQVEEIRRGVGIANLGRFVCGGLDAKPLRPRFIPQAAPGKSLPGVTACRFTPIRCARIVRTRRAAVKVPPF